jgi:TPR repeat protein
VAQGAVVEMPAAAPAAPLDSAQDAQEKPPEAAPQAAPITSGDEPPVPLQPAMTHLPSAAESAPQSSTVEPSQVEPAAGPPASTAIEPVARTPLEPPAPPAAAAPPASPPLPKASTESLDTERLMRRGHALLQEGDVAAARLFFDRAAAGGHAPAFTALGQSYDPLELRRLGVIGIKGDPGRALELYRAANTAGDASAQQRGARLSGWVEGGQR